MDPHDKVMFCGNDNAYSNAELDHYAQQAVDTFLNAYAPDRTDPSTAEGSSASRVLRHDHYLRVSTEPGCGRRAA
jgi:hypothetical protein